MGLLLINVLTIMFVLKMNEHDSLKGFNLNTPINNNYDTLSKVKSPAVIFIHGYGCDQIVRLPKPGHLKVGFQVKRSVGYKSSENQRF